MAGKSVSGHCNTLLVDIGNTQIKYAIVNKQNKELDLTDIHFCLEAEELTLIVRSVNQVLVSSVGSANIVLELERICARLDIKCKIIQTEANTLGIQCAYKKFQTLGVDRWLAILAAREITDLPVAVIDLGTANTCDIVVNNCHLGGWIAPGVSLMRDSLLNNTEKVFADTSMPVVVELGNTTETCVSYGCLASQMGFVMMIEEYLINKYQDYLILVTGGGQKSVNLASKEKILFFPNLVLKGLMRLI